MNLRTLADDELMRHAYVELDPLTSTDLERELLRRFEEYAVSAPLLEVLDEQNVTDPKRLEELLLDAQTIAVDFASHNDLSLFDVLDKFWIGDTEALFNALALAEVLEDFDLDDPASVRKTLAAYDELISLTE